MTYAEDWGGCLPHIPIRIDDYSPQKGKVVGLTAVAYFSFLSMVYMLLAYSDRVWMEPRRRRREETEDARRRRLLNADSSEIGEGMIGQGVGTPIQSAHPMDCAICLEPMPIGTSVRILPCRHAFHDKCINDWFKERQYTCPMCKFDMCQHIEEQREAKKSILEHARNGVRRNRTLRRLVWEGMRAILRRGADANRSLEMSSPASSPERIQEELVAVGYSHELNLTEEESPSLASSPSPMSPPRVTRKTAFSASASSPASVVDAGVVV